MPFKYKEDKAKYHKEYHAQWYQKNKEKVKTRKKERIKKIREWFIDYKSTLSCEQCGTSHPAVIDFHHKDGYDKLVVSEIIGKHGGSKKLVLEEIEKCRVLCANCHRILHWDTRGQNAPWAGG